MQKQKKYCQWTKEAKPNQLEQEGQLYRSRFVKHLSRTWVAPQAAAKLVFLSNKQTTQLSPG